MKAEFGINRERHNRLFYKEYQNDKGLLHFHSQIELYFVDDGEMEVFVNNYSKVLQKGQMSVALSYDAHAYRTPDHSKSSVFIIPPYLCEEFIAAIKNKRVTTPFICDSTAVQKIKDCINEINRKGINEIKLSGYIYVILGTVMENICFETTDTSLNPQLSSRILFYLNEHYKEDLTLDMIAAALGYNPSYLSRYFKSCFHVGINQ